jgi:uncharacterized surface protein with fasciclin (FAS1) repeats
MKDLIATAINAGNFKTLINALYEAGLADTLSSEGPFTIFAPTDKAFSKLPSGRLDKLLNDKERLTEILTYHVIDKKIMSVEVRKNKNIKTVNGKNLLIKKYKGIKIDNANIIKLDIECLNGVIHIIDEVLMPEN